MRIELTRPDWATHLLSDLTDWKRAPLPVDRLAPFEIPDDAYFEYAWRNAAGELLPDPANPGPQLNPWWEFASHIKGPDFRPDPLAEPGEGRPRGRVLRLKLDSALLGQSRSLLVYSPPGLADSPLPHVLFQDGKAYHGWGKAPRILDRLLEAGEITPAHLVFVPPVSRTAEYAFNPRYRRFLVEEVMPLVERRAPCDGRRIAWGASLGGLLSAQLAWERPDLFDTVVTQSGAYLFSQDMDLDDPFHGNEDFLAEVSATATDHPAAKLRWHVQCGTLEWLADSNRRIGGALADHSAGATLRWTSAGHNWMNWRGGIPDGFRFALGGG